MNLDNERMEKTWVLILRHENVNRANIIKRGVKVKHSLVKEEFVSISNFVADIFMVEILLTSVKTEGNCSIFER